MDGDSEGGRGVSAPAAGGIAAFAALLGLLALPATAKRLRRSRRRAASAAARVVGAWRETVDRLVELGMPVPASLTASEVARETRARFPQGAGPVGQLVPLVAVAVYAPFEPDGTAADRAWRLAGEARSSLRRGTSPGRRLRALVDPRPLLGADRQARRAGRAQTAAPTAVATAGDAVDPDGPRPGRCRDRCRPPGGRPWLGAAALLCGVAGGMVVAGGGDAVPPAELDLRGGGAWVASSVVGSSR